MRTVICALGLAVGLSTSAARADVSKAWAAAKSNLPANTQFVLAIDVAQGVKQPLYAKALEAFKSVDKDLEKGHTALKLACGWDPLTVIDGVVIAGDTNQKHGLVFYVQLTIDRTKASACLESALKVMAKGEKVTVKQDGAYTVATAGSGNNDTAYFPWVAPNVVMISVKPEKKDAVDGWFNQKTFGKSLVSAQLNNLDVKAAVTGAFASDKPIDSWVPITKAYGNITIGAGGKIGGTVVATATDTATAKTLSDEMNKEMTKEMNRDKTPPAGKKILGGMSISASGSDLTLRGSTTVQDIIDALNQTMKKKKDGDMMSDKKSKELLAQMEGFQKRMCACKDKKCADKVNDDMTKWGTEMAKNSDYDAKPSADIMKKSAEVMTKYTECMTKLLTAEQKP